MAFTSAGFVKEMPIEQEQEKIDGELQFIDNRPKMVDKYTDEQWMMLYVFKLINKKAKKGAAKLRLEAAEPITDEMLNTIIELNI